MHPCTCPGISWLLGRIVIGNIWKWREEVISELVRGRLDLLHEEDIWILLADDPSEFSLVRCCSDAVHIPRDDTHREK
jgi:hypothetical protein